MTIEEKKKAEKRILVLSLGTLVLAGVFLLVCYLTKQVTTLVFPVGMSLFLLAYWAISNILPVVWANCFEGKNEAQKQAYYLYALIDLVGLAGLVYFVVDLESSTGALIYAASIFLKKSFKDKFDKKDEEEKEEKEE